MSLTTTIGIYQTDNNQIIFSDNNDNGNIDFAKKHLFDDDTNLDRIKSKIKKYGM